MFLMENMNADSVLQPKLRLSNCAELTASLTNEAQGMVKIEVPACQLNKCPYLQKTPLDRLKCEVSVKGPACDCLPDTVLNPPSECKECTKPALDAQPCDAKPVEQPKKARRPRRQNKIKNKITRCEHVDAKYYSKGMCKNCYHRLGRVKLATACKHTNRKLYARNLCKGCYLRLYNSGVTKRGGPDAEMDEASAPVE